MSLMEGKKGLVMGVANERSIAWGIAQKLSESGAELAFTYLGDALKKRVIPLAEKLNSNLIFSCDVEKKDEVIKLFEDIKSKWGQIDFVVHAIAFSDKSELSGEYLNTTRENFLRSMLISCFSFTEVAKEASKVMKQGGSLLTLTYESTKAIPNYNVMGVCKSALEASVKYLARDLGAKNIRENLLRINLPDFKEESNYVWEMTSELTDIKDSKKESDSNSNSLPHPNNYKSWFEYLEKIDLRRHLSEVECILIEGALKKNDGSVTSASKSLKINRTTLIEKMKKYSIPRVGND